MLPSLNFSEKEPKFVLWGEVFKSIDNKNVGTVKIVSW
jgi:hypothetical protein